MRVLVLVVEGATDEDLIAAIKAAMSDLTDENGQEWGDRWAYDYHFVYDTTFEQVVEAVS